MAAETYTYSPPPETTSGSGSILRGSDDAHIPLALANRDYQEFLKWLAEGNPPPEGWVGPTNEAS